MRPETERRREEEAEDKIRILLKSGDIVRVKKGIYVLGAAYRRSARYRLILLVPSFVEVDHALEGRR